MKKFRDVNRKNLLVSCLILTFGFIASDLIANQNILTFVTKSLTLSLYILGIILVWDEIKKQLKGIE